MSANYTQFDWASDRLARTTWADEEDRMMGRIDRTMRKRDKRTKNNRKNHRNYA
ncbi:MAG: hypothetical protein J6T35_02005 [Bacteroidales bacterium]|nr:hypothetical protein [Bacteroidales bacterium]